MHVMFCYIELQSTQKQLFVSNGTVYLRMASVSRILMTLGGRWRTLGVMLWLIPFSVRDLGYRLESRCCHKNPGTPIFETGRASHASITHQSLAVDWAGWDCVAGGCSSAESTKVRCRRMGGHAVPQSLASHASQIEAGRTLVASAADCSCRCHRPGRRETSDTERFSQRILFVRFSNCRPCS